MFKLSLNLLLLGASVSVYADVVHSRLDLSALASSKAIAGTTAAGNPAAYANRGPIRAFDGSGIAADGACGTTANNAMFMLASNDSGSFPWYIQVDLGSVRRLAAVRLYNFNFAANGNTYTQRGVRNFQLYVSTAGAWSTSVADIQANYSLALSNVLAQATGEANYEGESFALDSPVEARFVALVALDDWDDTTANLNYNGIAEIQLFADVEAAPPPPSPCASFSICCVGDSITEGRASESSSEKYTYRAYLADSLADAGFTNVVWKGSHASPASGNALSHEGWSGLSAAQVADKYVAAADGDAADFLLLHAGHNYDATQMSETAIVAAATNAHARIIAAARARNPAATILYAKVITSAKFPKYSYIPALNDAVGALAAQLDTEASRVIVVDMADGWDPATMCLPDLVHPTEGGARRMAAKWLTALLASPFMNVADALVEAESFDGKGGWVVDPQFADVMGSPYLLAHGLGAPVADATCALGFAAPGIIRAWVRTRDWTPDWQGEKPGRFRLSIGGAESADLGVAPPDWGWVDAGTYRVAAGGTTLALRDMTGFEGRCDAIWLSPASVTNAPPGSGDALAEWRAAMRGESGPPDDVVEADFVVVGGGIAGTCAAIAAADAGLSVALVQDRPMLGGNASDEVRVQTQKAGHEFHWIVNAVKNRSGNAQDKKADDDARMNTVAAYPSIATHLGWRAYGVVTNAGRRLVAVDARNVETGARRRFVAPLFCDATGDGWLGYWAGAAYRMGREAKGEFAEQHYAQDVADARTMGNSLLWTTKTGESNSFPSVPWATMVSGSRADTSGDWTWEAGLGSGEDTIYDAEMLRDRLFRAIYGSFFNAKQKPGNERLAFSWVPYIAGKRESRRIVGDYVVREGDILDARPFEDAIGIATWTIDLHFYSGNSGFITSTTHVTVPNWWMPYRSLCCRDVPNLFLAGRCASYTHVASGSSRVMNAGGQQGVATGYAAFLCRKYGCDPREIYKDAAKTAELQALINKRDNYTWPTADGTVTVQVAVVVDNADASGVEVSGTWPTSTYSNNRYGANYLHNSKVASDDLWVRFTPTLPTNATYTVSLFWNGDDSRGTAVPVEIVYNGGVATNYVDMTRKSSSWNAIGSWPFAAGSSGSVRVLTDGQDGKTVIADAVRFSFIDSVAVSDDADMNGLPNDWERHHFLQMTGTDPNGDPDGDGYGNRAEWLAGTDPHDAASLFRIGGVWQNASASVQERTITLSWPSVEGRVYTVLRAGRLGEPFVPYREHIAATPPENTIDLPTDDLPSAFYRVAIEEP